MGLLFFDKFLLTSGYDYAMLRAKEAMGMNWTRDRSLLLSLVCVGFFAAVMLALDVGIWWIAQRFFVMGRGDPRQYALFTVISVYLCSVPAWLTLASLWRLLRNLRRGAVFTEGNVRLLRTVSWCCAIAALLTALNALYYIPYLFVAVAEAFMALIVRIVKNAFQEAAAMRSELDLTI